MLLVLVAASSVGRTWNVGRCKILHSECVSAQCLASLFCGGAEGRSPCITDDALALAAQYVQLFLVVIYDTFQATLICIETKNSQTFLLAGLACVLTSNVFTLKLLKCR